VTRALSPSYARHEPEPARPGTVTGRTRRRIAGPVRRPGATVDRGLWSSRFLLYPLVALAVVGVFSPTEFNVAPAEMVLEGSFFVATGLVVGRLRSRARTIFALAAAYLAVKISLMVFFNPVHLLDFVQAYKAYFYLLGLAFFVRRRSVSGRTLARVVTGLVFLFLIKYGYSVALLITGRPGVFMENNFELVMLVGLFYLAYPYMRWWRDPLFGVVGGVVLLSGSRSAAVCLLCAYGFLYLRASRGTWVIHVAGLTAVGAVVGSVFLDRLGANSYQSIDRYRFLEVFLSELRLWPAWEVITGSFPLTPLSARSCEALSYYSPLFSVGDPGTCYSVVLHSYILRAVFDQGIFGLALLYGLVWWGLAHSGASVRDRLALLSMISASAFSISAFNNVFVVIVLAVAFSLNRPVLHASSEAEAGTVPERDRDPVRPPVRRGRRRGRRRQLTGAETRRAAAAARALGSTAVSQPRRPGTAALSPQRSPSGTRHF
jgi:hypothetical protein